MLTCSGWFHMYAAATTTTTTTTNTTYSCIDNGILYYAVPCSQSQVRLLSALYSPQCCTGHIFAHMHSQLLVNICDSSVCRCLLYFRAMKLKMLHGVSSKGFRDPSTSWLTPKALKSKRWWQTVTHRSTSGLGNNSQQWCITLTAGTSLKVVNYELYLLQ